MRALLAFLLLALLPTVAAAQPACYPGGIKGTAIGPVGWDRTNEGWWAAWYCATDKGIEPAGMACQHGDCQPGAAAEFIGVTLARTPKDQRAAVADAEWRRALTGPPCPQATGALAMVCADLAAWRKAQNVTVVAPPPPPPSEVWKVAVNSTYTTRPTYNWSNGARSTVAAPERVAVGATCDPAVGAGDYRGVLGRADRVALCRKQEASGRRRSTPPRAGLNCSTRRAASCAR